MTWLITGGAGYIGAHVVHAFRAAGERVVVYDDLSTGLPERLGEGIEGIELVRGSLHDGDALQGVLEAYGIDGVVHLAAKKQPGESVERPLFYYRENIGGLVSLLERMSACGVERLVYSSSASTYGSQPVDVLTEDLVPRPESPYGETKLAGEWLLADVARTTGLRYAALRYFNAAGAGRPELADTFALNLIAIVFERLTARKPPQVYGTDYPTPDGTTIRDYVHVADLADAHVAAARWLGSGSSAQASGDSAEGRIFNVGTGIGTSTRTIVDTVLDVSGYAGDPAYAPIETDRRPGDPAVSIASADRARGVLGWKPSRDVREMVESAWQGWVLRHPEAARDR